MRDRVHWPSCPRCVEGKTYKMIAENYINPEDVDWFTTYSRERHAQCEGDCYCANFGHQDQLHRMDWLKKKFS